MPRYFIVSALGSVTVPFCVPPHRSRCWSAYPVSHALFPSRYYRHCRHTLDAGRDTTLPEERRCFPHFSDRARNMLVRGIDFWQGIIDFGYCQPRESYRQLCQPSSQSRFFVANYRGSTSAMSMRFTSARSRRNTGRALHHAMPNGGSSSSTSMPPTAMSLALRGRCGPRCDSRLGCCHLPRGLRPLPPRNAELFPSSCRWYRATSRRTARSRFRSMLSDRLDRHSDCRRSDATGPCRLDGGPREPAHRCGFLPRRHNCAVDCRGCRRIVFGDEVGRAHGRTSVKWFSCIEKALPIFHILSAHGGEAASSTSRNTFKPYKA